MSTKQVPSGRGSKKVLSPSMKYEIWLRLVRGEVTMGQAATEVGVDRSTIVRLRKVAKEGALEALAASRPGRVTCVSVNVRFFGLFHTTSGVCCFC